MIGITEVPVPSVTSQRADLTALRVLHIFNERWIKQEGGFWCSEVFTCRLSTCFAVSKVGSE